MFPTVILCACVILQEVQDKYTAVVKMIDSGDKLKLDQSHLETVIPAPGITVTFSLKMKKEKEILNLIYRFISGKRVLIVNGQYKDTEAILEGINEHKFSATLMLDSVSSL